MKNCHLTKTSAVALVALVVSSAFGAKIPDGMQWGVTFGFYATNGYFGSVEAKAEIDAIARAGATWVTVVPTVWQDSCSSAFQYKDFALTPNDIELMDAIDLIHAKGMKVQLHSMLECKDGAESPSGLDVEAEPDEDEQAMYMEALFRVFAHETWCRGFHWWKWDQHSSRREGVTREQVRARDFTFRGKKAEAVFRRWATR